MNQDINTPYSKSVRFLGEIRGNPDLNKVVLDLFYEIATNKNNAGMPINNIRKDKNGIRILEQKRKKTLTVTPDSFLVEEGEKVLKANSDVENKDDFFKLLVERLSIIKEKGLDDKGHYK